MLGKRYHNVAVLDDGVIDRNETDSHHEMVGAVGGLLSQGPACFEVRMYERGRPPRVIQVSHEESETA